ncbi:MAG TPA: hypothetical protein VF980_02155 [Thermoanaerobaculia bacterium]
MKLNRMWMRAGLVIMVVVAAVSCSSDFSRNAAPVELIVTNSQDIQQIDLNGNGASGNTNCDKDIGTINIQGRLRDLGNNVDPRFLDVRVTRFQVSYVRTDGGTAVPAPFTRSIDIIVQAGGSASLSKFLILQSDALTQAPFVSLLPNNGGRDPQTGRPVVQMDVVIQLFGETLSGVSVSGSTRFPLDFCFQCGGCA